MRPKFNFLALVQSVKFGKKATLLITLRTPRVVVATCYGDAFHQQGLGEWTGIRAGWMETTIQVNPKRNPIPVCKRVYLRMGWRFTPSILPTPHWSVSNPITRMWSNGSIKAQNSIQLWICRKAWTLLFTNRLHQMWQSLCYFANTNGHKYYDPDVQS